MLLRLSMLVSLLLLAFTTACTQAPPPDTHDADVQSLKDTEAAWAKVMAAKDFEKSYELLRRRRIAADVQRAGR